MTCKIRRFRICYRYGRIPESGYCPIDGRKDYENQMVSLRKVRADKQEQARIRKLFLSAFPRVERPPYFLLKRHAKRNVDWWSIFQDDVWAGFFYVIRDAQNAYVSFFAIDPAMRGKGCGTEAVMQLIRQYAGKCLFLAIEPVEEGAENYSQRVSRRNFYLKCGLSPQGKSIQEGPVIYELLGVGGDVRDETYRSLMGRWLGTPLKFFVPTRVLTKPDR